MWTIPPATSDLLSRTVQEFLSEASGAVVLEDGDGDGDLGQASIRFPATTTNACCTCGRPNAIPFAACSSRISAFRIFPGSRVIGRKAAAGIVVSAATRVIGWSRFSRFNYGAALASYVLVASIISWCGMAIPLVLRGNTQVWASLKRSVELSNGYEGALFWLVVQSVAGSFVAWYATYYGLRLFFPAPLRYTIWYGWLVYLVAVLASAAVEPPIFIGFSLLADPEQLKVSALPGS
jgi:hypothetical protein